jgi:hypothetical protein
LKQSLSGDVSRESLRAELAELRETMMKEIRRELDSKSLRPFLN